MGLFNMVEDGGILPDVVSKRPLEKRPQWTMDIMILSNLNEIAKFIDNAAIDSKSGNLNALIKWKAGLAQFYVNIRSFLQTKIVHTDKGDVKLTEYYDLAFTKLNEIIDPISRELPSSKELLTITFELLDWLTNELYINRNDIFMRFVEIMNPREKAIRYNLGGLPDDELNKIVDDKLGAD